MKESNGKKNCTRNWMMMWTCTAQRTKKFHVRSWMNDYDVNFLDACWHFRKHSVIVLFRFSACTCPHSTWQKKKSHDGTEGKRKEVKLFHQSRETWKIKNFFFYYFCDRSFTLIFRESNSLWLVEMSQKIYDIFWRSLKYVIDLIGLQSCF